MQKYWEEITLCLISKLLVSGLNLKNEKITYIYRCTNEVNWLCSYEGAISGTHFTCIYSTHGLKFGRLSIVHGKLKRIFMEINLHG